ncbi:ECF transporter S component [uncultured Thomasclavelia sp.]|uniref:ECF transporter S component n=1 Tax=uncultured Thomasclavelia sp. TaxID=3025759 RepID=UPI0025F42CE4|nr:ECF transporter S component [uncultured Thomasclavelia sp.]
MKEKKIRMIALIAIFGALAAVLMMFRFPLPFMPPFLSFDLAGVPELIVAFTFGPVAGILVVVLRILLQLVISGTNSMFTGELQGLMLSLALVLPASIIYCHNKTKRGAIYGMLAGSITNVVVAVFTNMVIIIPFYVALYGMDMDAIISMTQAVNPYVDSTFKLVLLGIIPFNIIKNLATCLVTFVIYKKISPVMHRYAGK